MGSVCNVWVCLHVGMLQVTPQGAQSDSCYLQQSGPDHAGDHMCLRSSAHGCLNSGLGHSRGSRRGAWASCVQKVRGWGHSYSEGHPWPRPRQMDHELWP